MKKRILFVDDEPMILQGLQRSMRPMRGEWEMEFTDSGEKALQALSQREFDVIVSDMRMPGMNGAQLLNEVMARYPTTVRLILSGHADQDLVMSSVGSTHQFLTKPCEPEMLRATVNRASALGESLKDRNVKTVVAQMNRLPSLPRLYIQITEALQSGDASAHAVGEIVARDMAMSAQLLKLVNSAFFSRTRWISNVREAVTFLGMDTVKSLVLCLQIFSSLDEQCSPGFSMDALWNHSLSTASYARAIARLMNCPRKVVDECYVSGLLHDAGRLVLSANFPDQYKVCVQCATHLKLCLSQVERERFGATHAEIGGYLLGLWGLPVPVVEAVALHHNPSRCTNLGVSPLVAAHVGDVLAHENDAAMAIGAPAVLDFEYLKAVGVNGHVDLWRETIRDDNCGAA